jgi:hypothetical protein
MTLQEIDLIAQRVVAGECNPIELMEACGVYMAESRPHSAPDAPPTAAESVELHTLLTNTEALLLVPTHSWATGRAKKEALAKALPMLIRARKLSRQIMNRQLGEDVP